MVFAVALGLLYAVFTAREAAGIAYCQQTAEGIDCNTKVALGIQSDPALSSDTHSLPCLFNTVPSSGWQLQFMKNVTYKRLCQTRYDSTGTLRKLISSRYSYNITVDGTPALWCLPSGHCSTDLKLGCHNGGTSALDCAKIYDNLECISSVYTSCNHFHFKIGVHLLHQHQHQHQHQDSLAWEIQSVQLTLVGCPGPPCAPRSHPEGLLLLRKHDAPFDISMSYSVEFVDLTPSSRSTKPIPAHRDKPALQSESVWSMALLLLATVYTVLLFVHHWRSQLKKSAYSSKVEMREELPESPECDVFLSILVCGGERLALTALTVVVARWLNILPTTQMSFLEPIGLLFYTILYSLLCGFVSGYVSKVILKTPDVEQMSAVVASFLPSSIFMFVCISNQLAIFSKASFWGMLFFFLLLWVGIDLPLSIWGLLYGIAQRIHQSSRSATDCDVRYGGSIWRGRIMFAVGSTAPFLCILPQLDPILDYLQGINTLTFNFGYALLHFGGMLVTSGLYGFIATGEHTNWHWSSFFAGKYSLLLHLVYLLHFSKAYAGHIFLFLNWAVVMLFSFFLMSGAMGFLCTSLGIASTAW
eukprot:Em0013g516a